MWLLEQHLLRFPLIWSICAQSWKSFVLTLKYSSNTDADPHFQYLILYLQKICPKHYQTSALISDLLLYSSGFRINFSLRSFCLNIFKHTFFENIFLTLSCWTSSRVDSWVVDKTLTNSPCAHFRYVPHLSHSARLSNHDTNTNTNTNTNRRRTHLPWEIVYLLPSTDSQTFKW